MLCLPGPSYVLDTACSSGLLALHQALSAIRAGLCDAAVVGAANLCLKPATTMEVMLELQNYVIVCRYIICANSVHTTCSNMGTQNELAL